MITNGVKKICAAAEKEIETLTVDEAMKLVDDPDTTIVDIRDIRELWREGTIPGSVHAPCGMLEFWVDPESPYYRDVFGTGKKFVLFCAAGMRSALATKALQDMGLEPVAHIGGGFGAWKEAGGPIEEKTQK